MHFGLTPCQEAGRYQDSLEQVRWAEALGFDSAWLYEHHLVRGHYFPTLIGLAGYAVHTQRIRLGTGIVALPLHQPLRLAEDLALIDEMSRGRLEVGVGLGYREEEFRALGVPFEERAGRLEEGIEIVQRLWSGEAVSFTGRYFRIEGAVLANLPVQRPRPPLWIGGWSERSIRRAARLGDGWIAGITADLDRLRGCVDVYRSARRALGQPEGALRVAVERETFVAENRSTLELAYRCLEEMYRREHLSWKHENVAHVGSSFEELRRGRFLLGSPEEVAEEIRRYRDDLGVTHILCRFHFRGMEQRAVLQSMELFAKKVMPQLR